MTVYLVNLTDIIRNPMFKEVDYDAQSGKTYLSPRLDRKGKLIYLPKLKYVIEIQNAT